jgi:hypothetical protein
LSPFFVSIGTCNIYPVQYTLLIVQNPRFHPQCFTVTQECQCHQWSVTNITIIDCRNRNLTALPERLPAGSLDLWFQNNSITDISVMEYLARTFDRYCTDLGKLVK